MYSTTQQLGLLPQLQMRSPHLLKVDAMIPPIPRPRVAGLIELYERLYPKRGQSYPQSYEYLSVRI